MAKRTPTPAEKIGQAIYDTYKPQSVEEMQDALKKILLPFSKPHSKENWRIILVIPRMVPFLRKPVTLATDIPRRP